MALERMQVPAGPTFDVSNPRHLEMLLQKITESGRGTGWEFQSYNPTTGQVFLTRRGLLTSVGIEHEDSFPIELMRGLKPSDGERIAVEMESNPEYAGYVMTRFDPFAGEATMTKLTPDERRARQAVATAMNVKPWDVQVGTRPGGGFVLGLPKSYIPSKHDRALQEVASDVVGRFGWYFEADAAKLTGAIVPAEPPTFPAVIPYPLHQLGPKLRDRTPFATTLGANGDTQGETLAIDWREGGFVLVAGIPQSGKTVALNSFIASQVAGGATLAIVDTPEKAVDFLWAKPFCRPGGWGCDSLEAVVTSLGLAYEEGQKRAAVLAEAGVVNWMELPESRRFQPLFIVADELSALLMTEKVPTGVSKDAPVVQEILRENLLRAMANRYIGKIVREMRFVGIRMVLSTQIANANTGIPPAIRDLIGNKLLQGASPSKAQRTQTFSDEASVPLVPQHVIDDARAARGVGQGTVIGQAPAVYKTWYAAPDDYRRRLIELGAPTTPDPSPSERQIERFTDIEGGVGADDADQGGFGRGRREADAWELDPETGQRLSGFARANAARAAVAAGARQQVVARD